MYVYFLFEINKVEYFVVLKICLLMVNCSKGFNTKNNNIFYFER